MNFQKGTLRHMKIRERKVSIQILMRVALVLQDLREETLNQERCARRVVCEIAKSNHKLKEEDKATFHSLLVGRFHRKSSGRRSVSIKGYTPKHFS